MVEQNIYLDSLFTSLGDPVRRDILSRLMNSRLSVSEIASDYDISFAAVAKHIKVLELSKLVFKTRRGNEQIVALQVDGLKDATQYLQQYQELWDSRYNVIDTILKEEK